MVKSHLSTYHQPVVINDALWNFENLFYFSETVVAESVVVIKKLLQTQPSQHSDIIKHMAKIFDNITVRFAISLLAFDPFVFV